MTSWMASGPSHDVQMADGSYHGAVTPNTVASIPAIRSASTEQSNG